MDLEPCAFCRCSVVAALIVSVDGIKLCEWCMVLPAAVLDMYPENVDLAFTDNGAGWTCFCGCAYEVPNWIPDAILAAVPSVPAATACWHLRGEPLLGV